MRKNTKVLLGVLVVIVVFLLVVSTKAIQNKPENPINVSNYNFAQPHPGSNLVMASSVDRVFIEPNHSLKPYKIYFAVFIWDDVDGPAISILDDRQNEHIVYSVDPDSIRQEKSSLVVDTTDGSTFAIGFEKNGFSTTVVPKDTEETE